jgi:SAM-dependent methyltransferase
MQFLNYAKSKLATPMIRRLLRRESIFVVRARVARRYIRGSGVEIGGLNSPLELPDGTSVRYADVKPGHELSELYGYLERVQQPDIITDLESLNGIDDESLDFLVADHVMEHVEDPFQALASINRVLRQGGIAFIALPDKRFTFDIRRSLTSLDHLIRDFEEGPDWSASGHYLDWAQNVENLTGAQATQRALHLISVRENIHFHVWDYPAMEEMFRYAADRFGLTVEYSQPNRIEAIWVLRKAERYIRN